LFFVLSPAFGQKKENIEFTLYDLTIGEPVKGAVVELLYLPDSVL